MICRQQVAELAGHELDFSNKKAHLAVIGNGRVEDLKNFRKVTGYQGTLLTDPSRESYNLLQFKSGLANLIGLKSFTKSFSALKAGLMPGSLQGNAMQLGGVVVIEPDNSIRYFFQSSEAGDHPSVEDLLEALG